MNYSDRNTKHMVKKLIQFIFHILILGMNL